MRSEMEKDILKVLVSEEELQKRVQEMGDALYDQFQGKNPLFLGVLKGSFVFMADLMRACQLQSDIEFLAVSSYANATESSGRVKITYDLQQDITGRHLIIVEDILDSGNTLAFLKQYEKTVAAELAEEDRGFCLVTSTATAVATDRAMDTLATSRVLAFLTSVQDGVITMSHDVPGLVEFSRNLGVLTTDAATCRVNATFSTRSAIEAQIDASVAQLNALAAMLGAKTHHHSRYPGWNFDKKSEIRETYMAKYRALMGEDVAPRREFIMENVDFTEIRE